jgi:hypothetical protein
MRAGLVRVTVAPGRGFLSLSTTRPWIEPVCLWAKLRFEKPRTAIKTKIKREYFLIILPPFFIYANIMPGIRIIIPFNFNELWMSQENNK